MGAVPAAACSLACRHLHAGAGAAGQLGAAASEVQAHRQAGWEWGARRTGWSPYLQCTTCDMYGLRWRRQKSVGGLHGRETKRRWRDMGPFTERYPGLPMTGCKGLIGQQSPHTCKAQVCRQAGRQAGRQVCRQAGNLECDAIP